MEVSSASGGGGAGWVEGMLRALDEALPAEDDTARLGGAALCLAAAGGHEVIVECLLSGQAAVDGPVTRADKGESPLMRAAACGHVAVVRRLLAAGAWIHAVNGSHVNAAHQAAAAGHVEVLELLLCHCPGRAGPAIRSFPGLDCARIGGDQAAAEDGDKAEGVNHTFRPGETGDGLMARFVDSAEGNAGPEGRDEEAGPAVVGGHGLLTARDLNKWSCVHHAAFHGRTEALRALVRREACVNLKDRWGRLPLAWAMFNGHIDAARALVEAGAHLREGGEGRRRQPQLARQRRLNNLWSPALHLAVKAALREPDSPPERSLRADAATWKDETDAEARWAEEKLATVRLAVEQRERLGVNLDAVDSDGRTALHEACACPCRRCKAFSAPILGTTAHCAADDSDSLDPATALPAVQARNDGCTGSEGTDEWHMRRMGRAVHVVRTLLEGKPSVLVRDKAGRTALNEALRCGNAEAAKLLHDAGSLTGNETGCGAAIKKDAGHGSSRFVHRQGQGSAVSTDQRFDASDASANLGQAEWITAQNVAMGCGAVRVFYVLPPGKSR